MIEVHGIKGGRPDWHQVDKSSTPLRFRKSVACTVEGAWKQEVENEGERARTPRAAVTAGTTSAMRQPMAFNVALLSASRCTWHHSPLGERRWNGGGDIKDAVARRPA